MLYISSKSKITETFGGLSSKMNLQAYRHPHLASQPSPHNNYHIFSRIGLKSPKRLQLFCSQKKCLRCNTLYEDSVNSPIACSFHGHTTGEKGLFAYAPPHQGIDGEWSDKSGVTVYRWNEKDNRPNTGIANWKKRWSCCAEYDEKASPCRRGWHVSYDDGFTLY